MSALHNISVEVNGTTVSGQVKARTHLIDFLRETLQLTGSHVGCEHGVCGACTIRVDGVAVRGCLTLAVQASGSRIETIEGLTESGAIADLQQVFLTRNALQCGFCTPGMLVTCAELLEQNAAPTRDEIRAAISGNYCRCTGYHAIVDAVESVALARQKKKVAS
jgi:aerobic-type carbon monoxide dehydrogenase small subunit (CoxS/CutS family)